MGQVKAVTLQVGILLLATLLTQHPITTLVYASHLRAPTDAARALLPISFASTPDGSTAVDTADSEALAEQLKIEQELQRRAEARRRAEDAEFRDLQSMQAEIPDLDNTTTPSGQITVAHEKDVAEEETRNMPEDVVAKAAEAAAKAVLAHFASQKNNEESSHHTDDKSTHVETDSAQPTAKGSSNNAKADVEFMYTEPLPDYAAHRSASAQEYDPFPPQNEVCPVTTLTVKHDERLEASAAAPPDSALTTPGVGPSPKDIAVHLARYTGIWDMHIADETPGSGGIAQGQLYAPSRLPFVTLGKHFFADVDGRIDFAAMGTPGGDIGEFILGLCGLEAVRTNMAETKFRGFPAHDGRSHESHHPVHHSDSFSRGRRLRRMRRQKVSPLLNLSAVRSLLKGWLSHLASKSSESRRFYMQTDRESLNRLEAFVNASKGELLREGSEFNDKVSNSKELQRLVAAAAVLPEHVGSAHLRLMLQSAGKRHLGMPKNGDCRPQLTKYAITAFWEILLRGKGDTMTADDSPGLKDDDAMAEMIMYHVVEGYHEEAAIVSVYTMKGECADVVPLVVPGVRPDADAGDSRVLQVAVTHPSAVEAYRSELADFIEDSVEDDILNEDEEEDELYSRDDENGSIGDLSLGQGQVLKHMNSIGAWQLERVLTALAASKPRFAAFFTENPI